uniref:Uncharacterized protein n=1 Tax=Heterorhabditis bacteriophora TaxID=37862 RepID=A0A1I7WUL8_HETBA
MSTLGQITSQDTARDVLQSFLNAGQQKLRWPCGVGHTEWGWKRRVGSALFPEVLAVSASSLLPNSSDG